MQHLMNVSERWTVNFFRSVVAGIVCILVTVPASAADIKVLTAGAMRSVLVALAPEFERQSGHHLEIANDTAGAFSNSGAAGVSQTGLTTANKIYTFEVNASQLTTGKRYARLQIKEVNSAAVLVTVTAFGDEANHKPGNAANGANVTTQNVVA